MPKYCPRDELLDAARDLYNAGFWRSTGVSDERAAELWQRLRDAAGLAPGTATAAGVAAPAQAEPRDDHSLDYIADEYAEAQLKAIDSAMLAAPSPAAEDGLVERLNAASHDERLSTGALYREAAARIERQAQEIAEMKRERQARNAIDPVTRLHNICDAMAEDRADSPYSQEAWDAQDEAYREKCADLAAALRRAEALRESLRASPCPRPANERPDGWTAGQCYDEKECGCATGWALRDAIRAQGDDHE